VSSHHACVNREFLPVRIPFQLHRRIPFIRRPFYQRDAASNAHRQAIIERDRALAEIDVIRAEYTRLAEQQNSEVLADPRGIIGQTERGVRHEGSTISRAALLLSDVDLNGIGLEIGPLAHPLVPRSAGRRIFYADYACREELVLKSHSDPHVDVLAIPEIDYIVRSLNDYQSIEERFDYILASHVIEHTPDFIGWLKVVLGLLHESGRLVLAIPDKRYCFDCDRPLSTFGDALEAYFTKRSKPGFRQVFDGFGMARQVTTQELWDGTADTSRFMFSPEQAMATAKSVLEQDAYVDAHCWVFTCESFRDILMLAQSAGILSCRTVSYRPPQKYWNEFHITLAGC
jgi:predicted SAM-dependent methyltransferase